VVLDEATSNIDVVTE
jgi:ATP-binding cassette, subfamily C (CFTR/MRP), member 1